MAKSIKKLDERMPSNINQLIDADPDFYRGTGSFNFPNGDRYEGEYVAHRKGLVWREGEGIYYTQDGQSYKGKWYNDKLISAEEAEINFPNGARYIGHIDNGQYVGSAMYTVDEGLHILAEFAGNKPVGPITLLDIKGREWSATAGENGALLLPEHVFFNNIAPRLGKGKLKIRTIEASTEKIIPKVKRHKISLQTLEAKIFAKSKKTMSDLKFEDSSWYQNYVKFKTRYDEVKEKITMIGEHSLCQEDREWIEKFREFKEKYTKIMENRATAKNKNIWEYELFELYNSEKYMQGNSPVSVFYPTETPGEGEECDFDDAYKYSVKF
ncbi:uncharacterized protein LOC130903867 [Diorhabda carinulata]|uniref:uncharacterized protein LOC130903867 n=1 Tax=Diorhabda carinulata TaxID=1163345 RepID=UPI0025A04B8D|nr:uncharacterized protein LOC130903867 [Diorhabda carinulata]